MTEYPDNSYKTKAEQTAPPSAKQKLPNVTTAGVQIKKKGEVRKFTDIFIAEDASNVKNYILMDVLVPAVKKAISDIVRLVLYGEVERHRTNDSVTSKISYDRFYDRQDSDRYHSAPKTRAGFDYDRIIFETRGDAESVLVLLDEAIEQYGIVSVADLYDACGKTTDNYMVNRYGWDNLRTAEVIRVSEGYILRMPKAKPINK